MGEHRLDDELTKIDDSAFVADDATIIGDVHIGAEASVWFGAVLRGDMESIRIGPRANVQDGTVVHTDTGFPCVVEEGVTIGHNAIVHGCTVKKGSLIGMGSCVMNGAVIGEDSVVAAGALVAEGKEIPPRSLVVGVPGKVVRELSEAHVADLRRSTQHYVDSGQVYRETRWARGRAAVVLGDDRAQALASYPHARRAGDLLFVSGVSSRRADNTHEGVTVHEDGSVDLDVGAQTRAVIQNIEHILRAAGLGLEHLVDLTTFLVDMDDFPAYNEVYNGFFDRESGPARTTVAVRQLPHPNLRIEMKAVAAFPRTRG